jgi:hypothetical protein
VTSAEEENDPGIVAITELAADGKTESVPVETSTPVAVSRSQQYPATEYVHHSIMPSARWCRLAAAWP